MLITLQAERNIGIFGTLPAYSVDINPNGLQIDRKHWSLWLALANRYAEQGKEVGAIMILDDSDRILLAVPEQEPTASNVLWQDIYTAVLIDGNPLPTDFDHIGTVHSHHYMGCSFSATDDLGDLKAGHPIAFHLLSRNYPDWVHEQSFCIDGRRIIADFGLIPKCEPAPDSELPTNLPIIVRSDHSLTFTVEQFSTVQQSYWQGNDFEIPADYCYQHYQSALLRGYDWDLPEEEQQPILSRRQIRISPYELQQFLCWYTTDEDATYIAQEFEEVFGGDMGW